MSIYNPKEVLHTIELGSAKCIPVETSIATALGISVVAFSRLEKQAIDWLQKLTGSVSREAIRSWSGLSKELKRAATAAELKKLAELAGWFQSLGNARADLVHATPVTAYGRQLLQRDRILDEEAIYELADHFATCARLMNELYHA